MQYSQQPNRIAAEDLDEYTTWQLPVIDNHGAVVPSAEKEEKERQELLRRQEQETIEDVHVENIPQGGMTAQDMQEIFDTAEKDGFAQGHQAGFTQGREEGVEAGRQQGLMEMRQQLVIEQQRFHCLAQALLEPLAGQDRDIEKLLLDIVCTLTASVVQRELNTDTSHILALVQHAVSVLPAGSKHLKILLHPDDIEPIQTYAESHQLDWKAVADASVQAGGCLIETHESRVDFSVEQRLKTVLEQFRNKQLAIATNDDQPDAGEGSSTDAVHPSEVENTARNNDE